MCAATPAVPKKRWLEQETRTHAPTDNGIDWIVVCMHQTAMSTGGAHPNGADLGIRGELAAAVRPLSASTSLFCGHEHHYERNPRRSGAPCRPTR